MHDRWDDDAAGAAIARWREAGEDVALRTYTSRLIGADANLVLHGGGNTSVKTTATTLLGDSVEVLCVKGSGWNLDSLEPAGLPAVRLEPLRRLRALDALSDEDMVNQQRVALLDASAPNPSVETLLHAFLPHKFVDHSHADAILALTNLPDGHRHVRAALGDDVIIVPYVMAGFALAKAAAAAFEAQPGAVGMVLAKHGLFTFGASARESYARHVALVDRAEGYVRSHESVPVAATPATSLAKARDRAAIVAPVLRGLLGGMGPSRRCIVRHRATAELLRFVEAAELPRLALSGPLTPDHVIRTKIRPLVVEVLDVLDDSDALRARLAESIDGYVADYHDYFQRCAGGRALVELSPLPRVVWMPGIGLLTAAASASAADVVADIAEHTAAVKLRAACLGPFEGLPDADLFDMEYWSLEQAKLGKANRAPLAGTVALVTGGAGAIGVGVAKRLREDGAAIVLADRDADALDRAVSVLCCKDILPVVMDVTDADSVQAAFRLASRTFGGVDVVVANAGVAAVGRLEDLDDATFREVVDVNLRGTFLTLREAARLLRRQNTGGDVVIVSSKNVLGPGASFGAYSASKAGGHQLGRVAALELGAQGVRVNLVTPDAVFGDRVPSGLWALVGPDRARSKGISEEALRDHYRQRNLLRAEITPAHVGNAVAFFARQETPTTGAVLPVDGGVETAFPR